MRGSARRAITVDVPNFGWDRAVVSVLHHSTFAWNDAIAAEPLASLKDLGDRDRLSLTGQFAAHLAFLQFAGIGDLTFDIDEWAVVRKRGSDCRLVRTRATKIDEPPPVLTSIQEFASAIGAPPLDVLRQSWGRAETAYHEIEWRFRADAAADHRWLRASAAGAVLAPGIDSMRELLAQTGLRIVAPDDADAFRVLASFDDRIVILGDEASPLVRHSALRALRLPQSVEERAIVERIVAGPHRILVVTSLESFDEASRRVLDLLRASGVETQDLAPARAFLLSPVLGAMPRDANREWAEAFVQSPDFARYLDEGELAIPAASDAVDRLREPHRSFIAAVALLGKRLPVALVNRFLERLMSTARASDLVSEDICSIDEGAFTFTSESVREQALRALPAASRASLSRVAAEVAGSFGDSVRAARLLLDCGETPPAALKRALAESLFAAGRYRDAREFADEALLARIERRMGEYTRALERNCDPLVRAELLMLLDRLDEAEEALGKCDETPRAGYQRAILALERGRPCEMTGDAYFDARIATYRAIASRDLDGAVSGATKAIAVASAIHDRVDATLDLLFAQFCRGDWSDARATALDALLLVDQTQGDRAAGGILFTLAFLAADDGQCAYAAHLVERLRRFYGDTHDEKRLAELDLLSAAIDFSRGRFSAAERAAKSVLGAKTSDQIHEAAALIADEIDWIHHRNAPLRSTGATANIELANRQGLLRARRGMANVPLHSFAARLFEWENGGPLPEPHSGSEKLMLFRAALGRGRSDVASQLAAELHIEHDSASEAAASEFAVLRAAAALPFPFAKSDFGALRWRFATRNRLGQWQEIGSLSALAAAELDAILAGAQPDWIACSDRELLFIEGLAQWSAGSREAIASLFHVRAEHHRLRRLIEEEPQDAGREAAEGIVGESPAMRDVYATIARISRRDVPVCILGESGTGKELVARAIHRQSPRRHKPFTPINCAALPENLIESELFGHARGAFTGAERDRAGLIETTEGGTLFLDEIGEMPLAAQAKLLRFLQEGEFRRVGETTNRTADVRVVTATNRKLEAAVEQGRFREDLYYRIRGVEIALPPLRDRASDIPLLAAHFLNAERQKHRGGPSRLSAEAEAAFGSYRWPGNVRELQNTIRAAHALASEAREIDLEHLPERVRGIKIVRTPLGSYQDAVARFRRELIEKSLLQADGNQNQAAAMLKISRQALAYQIRELGILVNPAKRRTP
ncbi:MAG TPA: sigma 54-interacting transcriptional regulator [Thermoanaerobaculia bacterium]|nr:sigma 54-interacting transcriptional regulator [Thermoanaerobaculia bacterium]